MPDSPPNLEPGFQQAVDMLAQAVASVAQSRPSHERELPIEHAHRLEATSFSGSSDPADAEAWIQRLEKNFTLMKLLTWTDFRREFFEQYYTRTYRDDKQREFLRLVQGPMTVAQYKEKFTELSRFASTVVANELDRCRRFEDGLHGEIRSAVTATGWTEYGGLVQAAMRVERSITEHQRRREQKRKRNGQSSYQSGSSKKMSGSSQFQSRENAQSSRGSGGPLRDQDQPSRQSSQRSVQQPGGSLEGRSDFGKSAQRENNSLPLERTMIPHKFAPKISEALSGAQDLALYSGHAEFTPIHMALALISDPNAILRPAISNAGGGDEAANSFEFLLKQAMKKIPSQERKNDDDPDDAPPSPSLINVIKQANFAKKFRGDTNLPLDLLILSLLEDSQIGDILKEAGISTVIVKSEVEKLPGKEGKKVESQYGRDLVEQPGRLEPVIRQGEEIRRVTRLPPITNRINPVLIGEPGVVKTAMIEGLSQRIVRGNVQSNLADLRFMAPDMGHHLPDNAIDLVGEACASVEVQLNSQSQGKVGENEKGRLIGLAERLHKRVVGQNQAVDAVVEALLRSRIRLGGRQRPTGSFLFLGPIGVGKTELAKALAEQLFDDENHLVRINMSKYMDMHSMSRLIGAPPGYIGHEEDGKLTEAVRRRPYSVVLFDEVDKAKNSILNTLLHVLDDGRLCDGKGHTVDFTNTVIKPWSGAPSFRSHGKVFNADCQGPGHARGEKPFRVRASYSAG
ncbi:hypothetical protein HHK36_030253 [Tetracentron sinense]|uniref:Clp R domain-containing protein n=1 Tax=Tetracentron sinense TaxID=13715 RepID=A0A834YCU5_TETSI|nr:hypothetical protein HHK36_030253 [Tetracentron sinense]